MTQEEKIIQLLKRAKTGDEAAFEEFILLIEDTLRREIRKFNISSNDVDDILQEAIWKIWSNLERMQLDKSPVGWIVTITRNTAISFLRKQRKISFVDPTKLTYIGRDNEADNTNQNREEIEKIKRLLTVLPEKYRMAVEMRYLKNMSYEEISKALGVSTSNARQLVSRGVKKLRKLAEANGDEEGK